MLVPTPQSPNRQSPIPNPKSLHDLLLSNRALARTLARARVGLRPLAAHRQAAAVPRSAIRADFHQPLDVHRDFLAEVAFDAPLLLDDAADFPDVLFRQVLDADVGAHPGVLEDAVGTDPADAVDVRESDLDALGARKIDACNSRHSLIPAAACVSGSDKSLARRRGGARSCICRKSVLPTHEPS